MLTDCKTHLALPEHGVDAPQAIGRAAGELVETGEGRLEMRERLSICPPTLRLLSGQKGIVDGLFGVTAAAVVMGQQLDDLVDAIPVKLFERSGGARVQRGPSLLEQRPIGDVLNQRVLEDVDPLPGTGTLRKELAACQLSQGVVEHFGLVSDRFQQSQRDFSA